MDVGERLTFALEWCNLTANDTGESESFTGRFSVLSEEIPDVGGRRGSLMNVLMLTYGYAASA